MDLIHGLMVITLVHLLAAASPGPDFVLVSQQSLINGRKAGIACSFGIALGLSVHIGYSACGLAAIIANSSKLLLLIKILGGSYLCYLGIKGIGSKPSGGIHQPSAIDSGGDSAKTIGKGFLCNILNPKAPIYFVSLFTVVLSPDISLQHLTIYGMWIMILHFIWFSFVAIILSSPPVSQRFNQYGHYIEKVFGGAMLLLGLKVITTKVS